MKYTFDCDVHDMPDQQLKLILKSKVIVNITKWTFNGLLLDARIILCIISSKPKSTLVLENIQKV